MLCSFFSRICVRQPANSSSTLWFMPTDTSMNFTRYVHAKHLPSAKDDKRSRVLKRSPTQINRHPMTNTALGSSFNQCNIGSAYKPWVDTARERARSILLAAKMTARLRNKSMSCSIVSICSARVKEDLSTTEKMIRNASARSSSSCGKLNGKN